MRILDAISMLTEFGLTKQEARIYWTLFSEGEQTGYEAAKNTGISRSNTYTALAGLVEKGAAYLVEGAATRYTPVPLVEFCGGRITELERWRAELLKCQPERKQESDGYITVLGEKQILQKMRNMVANAEERIYASMSAEILGQILPELTGAKQRGLKVVLITEKSFQFEGATVYHAEKGQKQIRLIVDSSSVLTGDLSGSYPSCLYSRKNNLVELFKEALKNEIKLIELTEGKGLE